MAYGVEEAETPIGVFGTKIVPSDWVGVADFQLVSI